MFRSIPIPDGEEVAFIPGPNPASALRVRNRPDGTIALELMAFNETVGWYRQKSLALPREMVCDLASALRLATCLMPECPMNTRCANEADAAPVTLRFPAPQPSPTDDQPRRELA